MAAVHPSEEDSPAKADRTTVSAADISAWVDGQDGLHPEEINTPYARQVWDTYHLIGDVMRCDGLAITTRTCFSTRLRQAIAEEPPAPRWSWRTGFSALAVAAAVAVVAWVALPYFRGADGATDNTVVLAGSAEDVGLSDYLEAHRGMTGAGGIRRAAFGATRP